MNVFTISRNEQHQILDNARAAVFSFSKTYTESLNLHNFFSHEELEDIAADTACKAVQYLESYDPDKKGLFSWEYKIAMNCVKDAVAYKLKRMNISHSLYEMSGDFEEVNLTEVVTDKKKGVCREMDELLDEDRADRDLDRKEFFKAVKCCTDKLSGKNKAFYEMMVEGFKPKRMAEETGCTAGAASMRVFKIRKELEFPLSHIAREFEVHCRKIAV